MIGDLLRYWRGTRRISQLDLANQAETTARYVSFVETGRANPSRHMVLRLADALDVPFRERNELLLAAGFAPGYPHRPLESAPLRHLHSALDSMLAHHEPYPAVLMDRAWTVLRGNAGARRLFGTFLDPLPRPANILRMIIAPGPVREAVLNWPAVVTGLLGRVRREAVGGVVDPATVALLAELRGLPEVAALDLAAGPPQEPVIDVRFDVHGVPLAFFSLLTTVGTPADVTAQELRVEAFYPADDRTREAWLGSSLS